MHRLERLTIIARARTSGEEPSHDFQHVQRVADTARLREIAALAAEARRPLLDGIGARYLFAPPGKGH